jgi:anhydro-N-acetylmuramic acid kinase
MHSNIQKLYEIANKPSRKVIGLMSGTSLDGLDIALCTITGAGTATKVKLDAFVTMPYTQELKEKILPVFSKKTVSLEHLCLLNPWLALQHAAMIHEALQQWNIKTETIDLIASHGQTIYHAPKSLHQKNEFGSATLQIGDGDHLSVATRIITLSDFRQKHIAAGGEGAPLSLYGDYLLFAHETENRILLNIGGISNFTLLNAKGDLSEVLSSDTGPGNTIMDAYTRKYFNGLSFDKDGRIAQSGIINEPLLNWLKSDPFFKVDFPKTIGPELFNLEYLDKAQMSLGGGGLLSHEDILATLNMFTAQTICDAIEKVTDKQLRYVIYVSGGGINNVILMQHIRQLLPQHTIQSSKEIGIMPEAKEAILFAILANEAVAGLPLLAGGNATKQATTMGKISFPD